jgi:myo-inositol-1(or 4)-monophosphatase
MPDCAPGTALGKPRRVPYSARALSHRIDDMQGSANLNIMIKAARKAGRSLVKDFREVENLQVSSKGPGDFVSRADRAAEDILKVELLGARPNYGFLGEEGTSVEGKDPTRRWIVDPLDGTTNFLHGMPHWAVSIALEHKGEIVAGVVFDPAKDEMFHAEKGAGAWLNDSQRIRVSGRTQMIECVFATGIPFGGGKYLPATLQDLARLMPQVAGVRRWGSAALDLAYVAAGRYDGYWERGLHAWDVAAGLLLVREAGGLVAPIREGLDLLEGGQVIAANGSVFDRFAAAIRERQEA